jgi:hypothetical protein
MSRTARPATFTGTGAKKIGCLGVGLGLLGQAVQHPLGDRQFVPLDLDLLKLLGQLLVEGVQFAPAGRGGDPLPLLHPRTLPRSQGGPTC